jgi:peptide chain release factor 1
LLEQRILDELLARYKSLEAKLANCLDPSEIAEMSREYNALQPIIALVDDLAKCKSALSDTKKFLDEDDPEIKAFAQEELLSLNGHLQDIEKNLKLALLPKDADDSRNVILEVRAGTGGKEAALFAADLYHMYGRYAEGIGWKFEVMYISENDIGGYKEACAVISGRDVFSELKFESGVHRVQRVPETETGGRVHTSAATVAILPEAEELDIRVDEKDIRVDVYRSSGPGGQSVNTTDSAVRITHLPTGIVVTQQDEKSQHKNKAKAMRILRARLYDIERGNKEKERAQARKQQVGSGDRSERIRTYNFPQGRVTDHRIGITLYKINEIVKEGRLQELIEALITEDEARRLSNG